MSAALSVVALARETNWRAVTWKKHGFPILAAGLFQWRDRLMRTARTQAFYERAGWR